MRVILFLSFLAISFLVTGCVETSYAPSGFTGGYSEKKIRADEWEVKAEGNIYSSMDAMSDMVMMRSAEITLKNGYEAFSVVGGQGAFMRTTNFYTPARATTTGTANTNIYGNTAYTTLRTSTNLSPARTTSVQTPEAIIRIKLHKSKGSPAGSYDARKLIELIKPRFAK